MTLRFEQRASRNPFTDRSWAQRAAVEPQRVRLQREIMLSESEVQELDDATRGTKQLYEQYPYPSPVTGESLIRDLTNAIEVLFPAQEFAGWNILDAGCGSGHRLLNMAKRYPKAKFTGVDLSSSSLKVAAQLARKSGITNVMFQQANLLELNLPQKYQLIVSTGVIHHLCDPQLGLKRVYDCLSTDGLIYLWLYHSFGEFQRLLDRELVRLLWGPEQSDFQEGVGIMEDLGLNLPTEQYGTKTSNPEERDVNQLSINADAYLHPIVNAYRFDEAIEMFEEAGADWSAINGINLEGRSRLIDLDQVSDLPHLCVSDNELMKTERLKEKFRRLDNRAKLRAIELSLRPTGFSILAGKNDSFRRCGDRITHNKISFNQSV
jgi:2-polyprenyl-3-methyl-5-hydroxy-6-metoxy-1,4-benzoquinol methylase